MIAAQQVIDEARSWIGTPFHHQGRVKGAIGGVDCIGVVIGTARSLGIWAPDFDYTDYGRDPNNGVLLREIHRHCDHVQLAHAGPGCLLLMRWLGEPQHIAICAGETIIHALRSENATVETSYRGKWPKRTVHTFRFREVTYV